jgi:hypothetical protein
MHVLFKTQHVYHRILAPSPPQTLLIMFGCAKCFEIQVRLHEDLCSEVSHFIYLFFWIIFKIFLFYYSYVHTRLGSFLPPAPTPSLTTHSAPSLSPTPPQYPAEEVSHFRSNPGIIRDQCAIMGKDLKVPLTSWPQPTLYSRFYSGHSFILSHSYIKVFGVS